MKKSLIRIGLAFLVIVLFLMGYIGYLMYVGGKISSGDQILKYPETLTALLVIDVQEGTSGELSTFPDLATQSESLISSINFLTTYCQRSNIPVIYIKQETEHPVVKWLTNNALAKGTPGAEIDKRINVVSDHIFTKQVMDAFSNPALDDFLIEHKINRLLITGLDAAACARHTTLAAHKRGYEIIVVKDAVISSEKKDLEDSLKEFEELGIDIRYSSEIPEVLR